MATTEDKFTVLKGGKHSPCPFFGLDKCGCDVGQSPSGAHDVELMVNFCSGKFTDCSRYERLSQGGEITSINEIAKSSPVNTVAWDVLQHELRSPLAAILTAAEILERNPDRDLETRKKFVGVICDESRRMKSTVEALFNGIEVNAEPVKTKTVKTEEKTNTIRSVQMAEQSSKKGWIVALAGTGINLALGILYAWSIFKDAIKDSITKGGEGAFNWDLASINDPYALCCLVFSFAMIIAGKMQDKIGPKKTALTGGILVGLGFIMMSLSNAYWVWVTGFGVLAGTGIGFGYSAATPPALKWFPPAKTGLIAGIVVSGFGLASVYIAPLSKYLLNNFGIYNSMLFYGVAFMLVVSALSMLLQNPPQPATTSASAAAAKAANNMSPSQIVKTPGFYALWLAFFIGSGAGLMVIGSVAGMAKKSLGESAFIAVAVMAIGNAAGRIVAGLLSDKIGRGLTLFIMMTFQAGLMFAAIPLVGGAGTSPVVIVSLATLIGFNYGTNLSLFPSIAKDRWGLKNFGMNYGLLFSSWGIGGLVAARTSEMLVKSSGNYNSSFMAACAMLLVGAGISLSLEESRKPVMKLIKGRSTLEADTEQETEKKRNVA